MVPGCTRKDKQTTLGQKHVIKACLVDLIVSVAGMQSNAVLRRENQ